MAENADRLRQMMTPSTSDIVEVMIHAPGCRGRPCQCATAHRITGIDAIPSHGARAGLDERVASAARRRSGTVKPGKHRRDEGFAAAFRIAQAGGSPDGKLICGRLGRRYLAAFGATPRRGCTRPSRTLESFNPATGELVGSVQTITPAQVQEIVDDVARVQPAWAELTLEDRAALHAPRRRRAARRARRVAELLTREQGKPRAESYTMELLPTIDALHWCADNGPKILADEKITMPQAFLQPKKQRTSRYEPIGVVGVIAPWNYPWSIPFGEVAIALMAGNGVVLKPASLTPLLGERIQQRLREGRAPRGPDPHRPRRRRGSATRSPSPAPARSSSPARSRSAARSARSARSA